MKITTKYACKISTYNVLNQNDIKFNLYLTISKNYFSQIYYERCNNTFSF